MESEKIKPNTVIHHRAEEETSNLIPQEEITATEMLRILREINHCSHTCAYCPLNATETGINYCGEAVIENSKGNEQEIIDICRKWKEERQLLTT